MSTTGSQSFAAAMERISEDLVLVESAMREQLASASEVLAALGDHVLGSGGKRLRPALLLLAAELCGYTGPRRIHVAAAARRRMRSGETDAPCSSATTSTRAHRR